MSLVENQQQSSEVASASQARWEWKAWITLIFALPGFALVVLEFLLLTGIIYSRTGETLPFRLFYVNLFLLPTYLVFQIPAWFCLRACRNGPLARRLLVAHSLLTIGATAPVLYAMFVARIPWRWQGDIFDIRFLSEAFVFLLAVGVVIGFIALGWRLSTPKSMRGISNS